MVVPFVAPCVHEQVGGGSSHSGSFSIILVHMQKLLHLIVIEGLELAESSGRVILSVTKVQGAECASAVVRVLHLGFGVQNLDIRETTLYCEPCLS